MHTRIDTHTGGCIYSFVYFSSKWTRTVSEACRVIINQVKQKLHLVGYLPTQYYKDARYHEHKKKTHRYVSCAVEYRYFTFLHLM